MSTPANDGDLSPYERARLANIARNRAVLQQLGLDSTPHGQHATPIKLELAEAFSPVTIRKPKREVRTAVEVEGLRRSTRRLAAISPPGHAPAEAPPRDAPAAPDDAPDLDYADSEILLPEQLDDYEFEVYTLLRAWRLATCRPLDLEPYKVFQNRTLVEAVRRRRNDALWGGTQQQLLECWGIGPVKVQKGGYAWQLIEQMQLPAAALLLQASRDKDAQESAAAVLKVEVGVKEEVGVKVGVKEEAARKTATKQEECPPSSPAATRRTTQLKDSPISKRRRIDASRAAAAAPPPAVRVTRSRSVVLQF